MEAFSLDERLAGDGSANTGRNTADRKVKDRLNEPEKPGKT